MTQRIAGRHAILFRAGGRLRLRDESKTGTDLNGQRFREAELTVGDRFRIGSVNFEYTGLAIQRVRSRIGGRIAATGVGFAAGGRDILKAVELEIEPCSFVGIFGGSGQGKSTLMNALCGINPATSGEVTIDGVRVDGPAAGGGAGDWVCAAGRYRASGADRGGRDPLQREAADERAGAVWRRSRLWSSQVIERLGLAEHRAKRVSNLSGGQRKRVSVATELLTKPAVLFLDEPSSGLDPATEFELMKLLRRLAAHDCTVVCTTHVLGRSYLFDKIVFVHGGRLVFVGSPQDACEYFGVKELDEVYIKLADSTENAEQLERRFLAWRDARAGGGGGGVLSVADGVPVAKVPKASYLATLGVQLRRMGSILMADRLNVWFLALQPVLIGLLIGWVAEDFVLRLFMCVVATLWFGCSNGAQQIVRERAIFRREAVCGLGRNSYLQSKYLFYSGITIVQALAVILITQAVSMGLRPAEAGMGEFGDRLTEMMFPAAADGLADSFLVVGGEQGVVEPEEDVVAGPSVVTRAWRGAQVLVLTGGATFLEVRENLSDGGEAGAGGVWRAFAVGAGGKLAALGLAALVGVAIGLAISGIVQTSAQAMMWVPLILIPQILFGGVVLKRADLSGPARLVSYLSPSYSAQRLLDVSNVFGRAVPFLSNRTKVPMFYGGGKRDTVSWEAAGKNFSENYARFSPINTSWQNLIVIPVSVGEHTSAYTVLRTESGSAKRMMKDTVSVRNDVLYRQGTIYRNLWPAWRSLLCLGIWVAACYGATLLGLRYWQRGK